MNFPFESAWYTPENLMSGTVAYNTLKAEYTRLRKNAGKRLRNLDRYKGGMYKETRTAEKIRDALDIKPFESRDMREQKAAMADFVSQMQDIFTKPNTIPEMNVRMKESLEYLHDPKMKGRYDFVDETNFVDFWNFVDDYRDANKGIYSKSPEAEILDLYVQSKKKNIPADKIKEDFDFWLDNLKKLKVMPDEPIKADRNKRRYKNNVSAWYEDRLRRLE